MKKVKPKKIKAKTHSGTKKVLNIRQSGSITIGHQGGRHNTGKKTPKSSRRVTGRTPLSKADYKRIKSII